MKGMNMMIGLIGKNGAGKSTICNLLKSKGFFVISLSDFVRQKVAEFGNPSSREGLIKTGAEIKEKFGKNILAKWALESAQSNQSSLIVFDSIRLPEEVVFLQDKGAVFIGVDAPIEARYERIKARHNDTDSIDFETFKTQDEYEASGKGKGQHIARAFELVNHTVDNSGSLNDLEESLGNILETIDGK